MVKTVFPRLGARVQSLVRDLRSHRPCKMVKIKKKKKKKKTRKVWEKLESTSKKSLNTGGLGNGK